MKKTFLILMLSLLFCGNLNAQNNTDAYAEELTQLGINAMGTDYEKALDCFKEAAKIRKTLFGEQSVEYMKAYNRCGVAYGYLGEFNKAVDIHTKVIALAKKIKHPDVAVYYINLGRDYLIAGDKKNAEKYFDDGIDFIKSSAKNKNEIGELMMNTGNVCYSIDSDDTRLILKYWEQSLDYLDFASDDYNEIIQYVALLYNEIGNNEKVLYYMGIMEKIDEENIKKPCDDYNCMLEKAMYYAAKQDDANAKDCFLKAIDMCENESQKMDVYYNYARLLDDMKNYQDAITYYEIYLNYYENSNELPKDYTDALLNIALCHQAARNYESAILYYDKVVNMIEASNDESQQKNYIYALRCIGSCYYCMALLGKITYDNALDYYNRILELCSYDQKSDAYADALRNVAKVQVKLGDYDNAAEKYILACEIYKELGDDSDYYTALTDLHGCYLKAGNEQAAKELDAGIMKTHNDFLQNNLNYWLGQQEIFKKLYGENSIQYAEIIGNIADDYNNLKKYDEAVAYYKQYIDIVRVGLRDEFRILGENDRRLLWKKHDTNIDGIMDLALNLPSSKANLQNDVNVLAYDAQLLKKGMLLNSAIEFEDLLRSSGDTDLLDKFLKIRENEATITELSAKYQDNVNRISQLKSENDKLQLELMKGCLEYADYTDYISYSWKDVQQNLSANDVAIEFASIETNILEETMVALVVKKDSKTPEFIKICDSKTIKSIIKDANAYSNGGYGNEIWNKIMCSCPNVSRIFFSCDGGFNQLAIENLNVGGEPINKKYEMYRLSSTKELCKKRRTDVLSSVVLLGGVDYDVKPTADVSEDVAMRHFLENTEMLADATEKSGVISYSLLPYTYKEINDIENALSKMSDIDIKRLVGSNASEDAFLRLSGSGVNVLHVTTHGRYEVTYRTDEFTAMDKCLLVMSGANLSRRESGGDCMVSASKIAKMNLRDCSLVVLSACESGLGHQGDDGVFGLQRGFKNAGAKTLVVALRKVQEDTSAKMMVDFYTNIQKGMTLREAFNAAQNTLRMESTDGNSDWANFVIIDAIN